MSSYKLNITFYQDPIRSKSSSSSIDDVILVMNCYFYRIVDAVLVLTGSMTVTAQDGTQDQGQDHASYQKTQSDALAELLILGIMGVCMSVGIVAVRVG